MSVELFPFCSYGSPPPFAWGSPISCTRRQLEVFQVHWQLQIMVDNQSDLFMHLFILSCNVKVAMADCNEPIMDNLSFGDGLIVMRSRP